MNRGLNVLIVVVTSLVLPLQAHAQSWSTEFGPPPSGNGLSWGANAMLEYQARLVVAGSFTQAGPLTVDRIAAWDGTQWFALGDGAPDTVEDLAVYEGDLIVAGGWYPAMLMRWDGSVWSTLPLPPGDLGVLEAVCAYNGALYVGSIEEGVSKLASWDGASWSNTPLPLDSTHTGAIIRAMTVHDGRLFITGAGPWGEGGFLLSWDGEAFGGPGWVFDAGGTSLHVYHEFLYVGGDWNAWPPIADRGLAIWDHISWIPFGWSPGFIFGIETYHGRIVLGGSGVTSFDGITYNGQNQQPLGGGCASAMWVYAVKEFQGDLYVAGLFDEICTQNGNVLSSNFGKWSEPVTAVNNRPNVASKLRVESAPNPFNPSVTLSIHVPARGEVSVTICDATGRVMRRLSSGVQSSGPYRVTWNGLGDHGEPLASGVYFARVHAGREMSTAKLVLLK